MTLEEKVSQLGNSAPAIPRLGIISYGWWNEALHGVAWSGVATVFPQAISFARTFDPELIHEVATAISTEARIMNNTSSKRLTYWSPTVNLARDPRWGRNEESYGEDPLLAARIATAFVRGMQGDDPRYLKTVSTPKHFVANNEEARRHTGSSEVDERNLRDFYMPAFRAAVEDGGAFSVMCAYNAVNGVPACANSWLLGTVLRQQWGFGGYVVSDCGAVEDIVSGHLYTETAIEASAAALGAGTDLNCGVRFQTDLVEAVTTGVVTEERIDEALVRLFFVRFKLGEFDPPEQVPYRSIPEAEFDGPEHRALAERTARASMVLLKNEGLLPLSATALESIAVIGPNAHRIVFGGYSGAASEPVTPLAGLQARLVGTTATVRYAQGTGVLAAVSETAIEEAAALAAESEVAVVVLGSDQTLSSEGLDRSNIDLPAVQQQLLEAVVTANPNTVLVLVAGMPFAIPWAAENVPAILDAGYAGQAAGTAIAGALFGDFSPAGRLPQTYYLSTDDLLPFDDYDLTHGRTYMFFEGPVLYPFGHGLGYSDFTYSNLEVTPATLAEQDVFTVSFDLGNSGAMVADEVAQVYVHDVEAKVSVPVRKLVGFARLELVPGEVQRVTIDVKRSDLGFFDVDTDAFVVEPGDFEIFVGASSADTRLQGLLTVE
jgi:beta-glucosidase